MEHFKLFFQAMRFGSQLADSAIWKNRQQSGNAVIGVLTVVAALLAHKGIMLTHEDIVSIAGAFSTIGFVWNSYLTVATSKSVGFGKSAADGDGSTPVQPKPVVPVEDNGATPGAEPARDSKSGPGPEQRDGTAARPESVWNTGTIMG